MIIIRFSMIVNKAGKDFIITDSGHKISVEQLKLIEKKYSKKHKIVFL